MENMPDIIYHYCPLEKFVKIIASKTLRLYDYNTFKDDMEMKWAVKYFFKKLYFEYEKKTFDAQYNDRAAFSFYLRVIEDYYIENLELLFYRQFQDFKRKRDFPAPRGIGKGRLNPFAFHGTAAGARSQRGHVEKCRKEVLGDKARIFHFKRAAYFHMLSRVILNAGVGIFPAVVAGVNEPAQFR